MAAPLARLRSPNPDARGEAAVATKELSNRSGRSERMYRKENRLELIANLPKIATEIASAMYVGLDFPVFFIVPNTRSAIVTFGTPIDPGDDDWDRVCGVACEIVEIRAEMRNLTTREFPRGRASR